jgi:hypothetical protein
MNNNEIFKMTYKTYILKMKNIRYIVIYDNNQHPLYIYNLELSKVIDVQKCKNLYLINKYKFNFYFNIPFSNIYKKYDKIFKKKCLIKKVKRKIS